VGVEAPSQPVLPLPPRQPGGASSLRGDPDTDKQGSGLWCSMVLDAAIGEALTAQYNLRHKNTAGGN